MRMAQSMRSVRQSVVFYLLLGVVMAVLLFPFYWGFITSLKFEVEIYDFSGNFLVPKNPSLDNYMTLFSEPGYFRWFWNTILVSTVTTFVSVLVSMMAGFAIARLRFTGWLWHLGLYHLSGAEEFSLSTLSPNSQGSGHLGRTASLNADLPDQSDPLLYLVAQRLFCQCAP